MTFHVHHYLSNERFHILHDTMVFGLEPDLRLENRPLTLNFVLFLAFCIFAITHGLDGCHLDLSLVLAFDQLLLALFCHVWVLAGLDFAYVWCTVVVFPNLGYIDDTEVLHSLAVDNLRIAEPINRRKSCLMSPLRFLERSDFIVCFIKRLFQGVERNYMLVGNKFIRVLSVELSDEARLVVVNDFFGDVFDLFTNLVLQVFANKVRRLGPDV